MTTRNTKAERIFRRNFYAAIDHIDYWGMENFDAFNRLETGEDERVCRRTVNAILALCDKKDRDINRNEKFGVEMADGYEVNRKAVSVVRNTCNDWIKREEEFKASLCA